LCRLTSVNKIDNIAVQGDDEEDSFGISAYRFATTQPGSRYSRSSTGVLPGKSRDVLIDESLCLIYHDNVSVRDIFDTVTIRVIDDTLPCALELGDELILDSERFAGVARANQDNAYSGH
jgi:hypothetical protein